MTKEDYLSLVDTLNTHAHAYYVLDAPTITDEAYDKLYHEVLAIEQSHPGWVASHSPTQRVGDVPLDEFEKANHIERMWSLEDVFDQTELKSWLERICKQAPGCTFLCEPKYDGASLNLQYENGHLQRAITRGNGLIGENVTQNARTIRTIPLSIPHQEAIEIRGEVVIYKERFEQINHERSSRGEALFANPRNAAAGSLRQLDSKITAERQLIFLPWGIGANQLPHPLLSEKMVLLAEWGFTTPKHRIICRDAQEIETAYKTIGNERESSQMMLDGMVIKADPITTQEQLGFTIKAPRFACAYKFPAVEKTTRIIAIRTQVGRTGVVTPVAEVEAVNIEGAMIRNATLHNFDEIERKGVKVGDTVTLIRSGDVIPKIIRVVAHGDGKLIERPTHCPECGGELLDEGVLLKCQNLTCPARVVNSLIHFVSKQALNIDGLGEKLIRLFYEQGFITDVTDIFSLREKHDAILALEGFKEKRVQNILESIENAKGGDCWRFVNALGIEHIGEGASKKICQRFGLDFLSTTEEELLGIDGFGVEMVASLQEFFRVNHDKIVTLLHLVQPIAPQTAAPLSNDHPLNGKKIVLTGTMSRPRDEIKTILESLGAAIISSVSKKTDLVIYGDEAGTKLDKARSLGVDTQDYREIDVLQ